LTLSPGHLKALANCFETDPEPIVFQPSKGRGERYAVLEVLQAMDHNRPELLTSLGHDSDRVDRMLKFGYGPFTDRGVVIQLLNLDFDAVNQWQELSQLQGGALSSKLKALDGWEGSHSNPKRKGGNLYLSDGELIGFIFSAGERGRRFAGEFMDVFFPSYNRLFQRTIWNAQQRRLLQLAIAVERYQRRDSAYPESLQQLVPEFLPQLPLDQFAEHGSFGYERTNHGFRVFANPKTPKWFSPEYKHEVVIDHRGRNRE
jgi:hypothetical protein